MLSVGFTIRVGRDVAILYGAYVLRIEPDRAWLHSALALLSAVPFLFAISSSDEDAEPNAFLWLDGAQLLLIAALLLYDLFPGALLPGMSHSQSGPSWLAVSINDYTRLRDIEILGLIALCAARTFAAAASHLRAFYANLLVMLLPLQLCNLLNDYVAEHGVSAGSPVFVLTDLPPLAFVILSLFGTRLITVKPATQGRLWISSMIRFGSPAFFALAVLLLSMQAIALPPHIGLWTSCSGLAIYGARSAFLQLRFQRAQTRLLMAQSELLAVSRRDPLTGLYNRRWFDQTLRHEWAHALRGSQPIALLIVDIDHFKEFNDAAGHKAGDECLVAVATALRGQLQREGDSVSRYGGEEFAIVLPFTDPNGARIVAERLREAVAELRYVHPGPVREFVTVSVGAASLTPTTSSSGSDELFLLADAALYQAKQRGRNRIEIA
jgi:diguanylate cyclase (GGDEF)-like protein